MKVVILSDIHGNAAALRRTLDEARLAGAERLIVLGDIIGYYYAAAAVLELIKEWNIDAIRGNHERLLAAGLASEAEAERYRRKYGSALDVARATLPAADIDWLVSLPDRASVNYEDLRFELCHGSPRDRDEYVYPDAAAESLDACCVDRRDIVCMGHTHYSFVSFRKGCVLLNPGSVGQARDHAGSASWCWMDTQSRTIVFKRTPFDVRPSVAEARRRDPALPYLATVLERGASASAAVGEHYDF